MSEIFANPTINSADYREEYGDLFFENFNINLLMVKSFEKYEDKVFFLNNRLNEEFYRTTSQFEFLITVKDEFLPFSVPTGYIPSIRFKLCDGKYHHWRYKTAFERDRDHNRLKNIGCK